MNENEQNWAEWGLAEEWALLVAAKQRSQCEPPLYQDEDKHMKIGDMIESKYLKQSDVPDPVIVTFESLKKVNVAREDEDPDYRWSAKFRELPKAMIMNVTNIKRAAKALGDDTEEWLGKQIELYVDPDIEFGGNIVGGLRLRGVKKGAKKPLTPEERANSMLRDIDDEQPPF